MGNLPVDCHSIADLWWHSAAVRRVQLGAQCRNRSVCLDPKLLYTTNIAIQPDCSVSCVLLLLLVCVCVCGWVDMFVCVRVSCSLCIESRHQMGQAETDREADIGRRAGRRNRQADTHTHARIHTRTVVVVVSV